jgi:hypothetical protein
MVLSYQGIYFAKNHSMYIAIDMTWAIRRYGYETGVQNLCEQKGAY